MEEKARLIKRFHTLLGKAGIDKDGKLAILSGYGVETSKALGIADLREICDKLQLLLNNKAAELDNMRKRVMRAIFRNLELKHPGERFGYEYVKRIACRAARSVDFNKIDINTLRGIYNAFCRQNKAYIGTQEMQLLANVRAKA